MLQSKLVRVPCVVGWMRPVVLVPASAFTGLSVDELQTILAHELAHVRRYDVCVNYVQTVVETLLFHNPAAWWISRQVRAEREHCCDDVAVEVCGDRLLYARALVDMESLTRTRAALSMAADGASLISRIRRLVDPPERRNRLPASGAFNIVALASLLALGVMSVDCHTTRGVSAATVVPETTQYSPSRNDTQGSWTMETYRNGRIQLRMRRSSRDRMDFSIRPDDLLGLTMGTDRTFRLERDAGTFFFLGDLSIAGHTYTGSGDWYFQVNSSYADTLESLEFRRPSTEESLELAIHDVSLDFVRGLDREGYRGFPLSKLVELHIHDVTPEYIHALRGLGYEGLGLSKLVEMQIHDVEPDFIRELQQLGYRDLSASKLVEMQIHDVTPDFIRRIAELGYRDLSASTLVEWQIHDVKPEYLRDLEELGYDDLRPSQLVEMRIHDVEPELIRELNELGYRKLSPSKLVEMSIHEVNPSFIRALAELGYEDVSPSKLVEMKIHNVTPGFIRELRGRGFEDLTPNRLIELRIHGNWR
jgi:hypothetical protein